MGLACPGFLRAGPGRRVLRPPCSRLLCRDRQANVAKKQKPVEDESGKASPCSPPLSPEQLERIRRNKEAALQRLASRSVPAGFGEGWRRPLAGEFTKPYFSQLTAFVADERKRHTIYPPPQQVFTWTQMCDIREVKVVILGQDPYHGPSQAHGLCFSVQRPVPPPPSLENIYKELSADIEDFTHPGHGDLTGWAKQGVLLLNAVLTVRAHQPNSHKDKGWEQFTDAVVSWLNNNLDGLVFMLWGAYAQKKGSSIDRVQPTAARKRRPVRPSACTASSSSRWPGAANCSQGEPRSAERADAAVTISSSDVYKDLFSQEETDIAGKIDFAQGSIKYTK
ncbi:Uracil-DNA glycosylase [Chelonia mydas]|uniref:Uracil-DNA glycosylase n=1 Tax=Chelonia mydas TaxID=8469 RepID=M7BN56_CHEMY|nr:Uracil-DNA glycosylase [Chelonia mydas]